MRYGLLDDMPSQIYTDIDGLPPGKVFYLELDGEGKMPVLHFGMTGAIQVSHSSIQQRQVDWSTKIRGSPSLFYRKKPETEEWPPRFMKVSNVYSSMCDMPMQG